MTLGLALDHKATLLDRAAMAREQKCRSAGTLADSLREMKIPTDANSNRHSVSDPLFREIGDVSLTQATDRQKGRETFSKKRLPSQRAAEFGRRHRYLSPDIYNAVSAIEFVVRVVIASSRGVLGPIRYSCSNFPTQMLSLRRAAVGRL